MPRIPKIKQQLRSVANSGTRLARRGLKHTKKAATGAKNLAFTGYEKSSAAMDFVRSKWYLRFAPYALLPLNGSLVFYESCNRELDRMDAVAVAEAQEYPELDLTNTQIIAAEHTTPAIFENLRKMTSHEEIETEIESIFANLQTLEAAEEVASALGFVLTEMGENPTDYKSIVDQAYINISKKSVLTWEESLEILQEQAFDQSVGTNLIKSMIGSTQTQEATLIMAQVLLETIHANTLLSSGDKDEYGILIDVLYQDQLHKLRENFDQNKKLFEEKTDPELYEWGGRIYSCTDETELQNLGIRTLVDAMLNEQKGLAGLVDTHLTWMLENRGKLNLTNDEIKSLQQRAYWAKQFYPQNWHDYKTRRNDVSSYFSGLDQAYLAIYQDYKNKIRPAFQHYFEYAFSINETSSWGVVGLVAAFTLDKGSPTAGLMSGVWSLGKFLLYGASFQSIPSVNHAMEASAPGPVAFVLPTMGATSDELSIKDYSKWE